MSPPADDGNEIEFLTPTTSQRRLPPADGQRPDLTYSNKDGARQARNQEEEPQSEVGNEPWDPRFFRRGTGAVPDTDESVRSVAGYSTGSVRRPFVLGAAAVAVLAALVVLALPGQGGPDGPRDANQELADELDKDELNVFGLEIGPDGIDLVPSVESFEQQVHLVQPLTGFREGFGGISPRATGLSAVLVPDSRDAVLLDLDSGAVAEVPGYTYAVLAAPETFLVTYGADGGSSVLISLGDWPLRSRQIDPNWVRVFLDEDRSDSFLALVDADSSAPDPLQRIIRRIHLDADLPDIDYPVDDIIWSAGPGVPIGTSPNGGIFELWADVEHVSIAERNANVEAYASDYPPSLFSNARFPAGSLRYVAPGSLLVSDETRALVRDCDRTQSGCSVRWLDRSRWQVTPVPTPESVSTSWRIDGGGRWLVEDNVGLVRLLDLESGRTLSLGLGPEDKPVRTFLSADGWWLAYQDDADLVLLDLETAAQFRTALPAGTALGGLVRTPAGLRDENASEPDSDGDRLGLASIDLGGEPIPESLSKLGLVATGHAGATTMLDLGSGRVSGTGGLSEIRLVHGTQAIGLTPANGLGVLNLESGDLVVRSFRLFKNIAVWEGYLDGTMWVASTDEDRSLFDVILVEQDTLEDRTLLTEAEIQFLPPILPWEENDMDDDGSGASRMAGSGRWRIVYDWAERSYLIESETGNEVYVAEGGPKLGVDVSADGRWVVVGSNGGEIVIADLDSAVYNGAGKAALEDLVQYEVSATQSISSIRFTQSLS